VPTDGQTGINLILLRSGVCMDLPVFTVSRSEAPRGLWWLGWEQIQQMEVNLCERQITYLLTYRGADKSLARRTC